MKNNNIPEQDEFDEAEAKGRELFLNWANTQPQITELMFHPKKYGRFDAAFYSGSSKVIAEIKYRNEKSTKYKKWMLEKDKYEAVASLALEKDAYCMFINFYENNKMAIWDLNTCRLGKAEKRLCPSTSAKPGVMVMKDVYFVRENDTILNIKL